MTLNRAMYGEAFPAYIEQVLAPTLRPGDIIIMDNLPARKPLTINAAIERTGAEMRYLPKCSPDFNPIEMAFSKIKRILKKIASRILDDLWEAIRIAIDAITPTQCTNYFTARGYEPE